MMAQNMAMRNRHMVIASMLDNARFWQNFGGSSFNDSDSSSEASDDLMSGPDAVAKMTNAGASGSFSMDYYRYMESKKNHHSFGGQTKCDPVTISKICFLSS
ncbi:uncharacterized protein [Dysidea avara]|uniref:uncharacterized protein isoform X1 n=1 Tax=Dysidea avara TaxID=196820 RepID=UPI00331B674C